MKFRDILQGDRACATCIPGQEHARSMITGHTDSDTFEINHAVVDTCDIALGGLNLSVADRRAACLARTQEPGVLNSCAALLATLPEQSPSI